MKVKFITHAGLALEQDGFTVMVDPWFVGSNVNYPVLKGLFKCSQTIDFHLTPCRDRLRDFSPNCILVSLFHPHHAPLVDIYSLISQSEHTLFGCPKLNQDDQNSILEVMKDIKDKLTLKPCVVGDMMEVGPFRITALNHTLGGHLTWQISTDEGSVIHLADARVNTDDNNRQLDKIWDDLKDLRPSMLFIAAVSRSTAITQDGVKSILENALMSPTEAARVTALINPRVAIPFAMNNFSIRERNSDFNLPAAVVEDQFEWALSHLAPQIRTLKSSPGQEFKITKDEVTLRL